MVVSCEKKSVSEEENIVNAYLKDSSNFISDTILINKHFEGVSDSLKPLKVFSYFDKKDISFKMNQDSIKIFNPNFSDHSKVIIKVKSKADFKQFKGKNYLILSKPLISIDKNYALFEVGLIKYNDKNRGEKNFYNVFLYKKVENSWKRLELVETINNF